MKAKKVWKTPTLTVHGTVKDLTQQSGASFIDVPQGTPADGDIASS